MLLQLYYEMNYFDQAVLMIDSVRKYVLKEKMLIESTRTSLLEFLKITGSLIKYKTEPATSSRSPALNSIEHNIMNLKNNQYGIKLWLIEKFIEFNQSKSQVI